MVLKGHEDCRRYLYFEGGPRFRPCLRIDGRRTIRRLSFSLHLSACFEGETRVREGSEGRDRKSVV